ncbi:hypothetical protein LT493_33975 [Streptomyces tricolor]|nr:hypothetical protein [Streptomyces tricolor]
MNGDPAGGFTARCDVVALTTERVEQEGEMGGEVVDGLVEFGSVSDHHRQFGPERVPGRRECLGGG